MNSKMMALAAVLVVGVLAAAGVGYAYTATYITGGQDIETNLVVVKDFTDADLTYDTVYDMSAEKTPVTTTLTESQKFTVTLDCSKIEAAKTKISLKEYLVTFSDGSTWNGTTFTPKTTDGLAVSSTVDLAYTAAAHSLNANFSADISLSGAVVSNTDSPSTNVGAVYISQVRLVFEPVA